MSYNRKALSKAKLDLDKYKKPNPYKKDILYTQEGQWKYPGQKTRIPSSDITMQGVPFPVFAQPNVGQPQMMYPGQEYSFPGASYVDEYPQMKKGGLVQMPKPSKKGLASKKYSRSLSATNKLFTENPLFKKPKSKKRKVFDPNAKYYQDGGVPYDYNEFVSNEPEDIETPIPFNPKRTENDPEDYDLFLKYSETAPENRRPYGDYVYGQSNDYDHYGMWEALGKPKDFQQALEMNPDWQPDPYDGYYHGFSVNPNTGVFLKSGKPGFKPGDTTWMEIAGHYLSPRAQEDTPVFDPDLQRFKYIPNEEDGGYIEAELTPEEIEQYAKGGYVVEELPDPSIPSLNQYAPGGAAEQKIIFSPKEGGCPKGEYWTGTECKKIPPNTKIVYSKKEYDRLTKLNKLQNQIYKDALSVEKYLRDINSRYHDNNLSHIEYYLQRPVNKSELRKWKSVSTLPKGWENQSIEYLPGSIMQSAYGANPWHTNQRTYVQDYFKKLRRANMTPKQWFYTNTDSTIDSKEPYVNYAVGMYPVFDKPSQKNYILGYKKEEQPINDFGYMAGTLAEELKAEQRMLEELQPLRPDLIKQDLGLPAVDAVYEDEIQPPTYTPTGDNYIINDYYISPSARKMQRKTNYNSDYYYDHYDDDGNLVLGETTKADQENRRINFKGASTKKDLKAQKEYNKAYDEYEKLMEQKELEKKFIESQIGMYKYLSNKKEGGLSSFKKGGLNSPKDLDPVTLEKYLSDLRGLENSIKKGYKNNKWYPHSSIEGGANTIAYGHKLQPGESFSSGLTEQQARDLQKKDVLAHQTKAEKFVDDKYGKGTYDKLPQNSQMLLTDYAYNLGSLNKFPSFVEGVVKGDKNKMLQQYERRGLNERNKWTKDVINTTDFSKDSDYGFNWMFDLDGWWNKKNGGAIELKIKNDKDLKRLIDQGYIIEEL